MHINRIYVDHVALALSLADSVRAQRDGTGSIGGNPLGRLLRWLRKGGPIIGTTAEAGPVSVSHARIAFR
jgi:hypothetical protein